jgi:hypothetical protein
VHADSKPFQRLRAAKQLQQLALSPERNSLQPPSVVVLDADFWEHSKSAEFWDILEKGGSEFASPEVAGKVAEAPDFADFLVLFCSQLPLLHCVGALLACAAVDTLGLAHSSACSAERSAKSSQRQLRHRNRGGDVSRQHIIGQVVSTPCFVRQQHATMYQSSWRQLRRVFVANRRSYILPSKDRRQRRLDTGCRMTQPMSCRREWGGYLPDPVWNTALMDRIQRQRQRQRQRAASAAAGQRYKGPQHGEGRGGGGLLSLMLPATCQRVCSASGMHQLPSVQNINPTPSTPSTPMPGYTPGSAGGRSRRSN